jgi:hypothetical protein
MTIDAIAAALVLGNAMIAMNFISHLNVSGKRKGF